MQLALVTGGNRGIGLEIARQLSADGIRVVIGARDLSNGRAAARDVSANSRFVDAVELDVTHADSVESAMRTIEKEHGAIDILVNNAGILIDGPGGFSSSLFDMTEETVRRTWETNVLGPVRTMKALLPGMVARGFGRVVNLSSRAGQLAEMGAGYPAYRMSKSALNALTRNAAAEVGPGNVKINVVCPGWCNTDMGGASASRTAVEGARTPVWLATLDSGGPTGLFFYDQREIPW